MHRRAAVFGVCDTTHGANWRLLTDAQIDLIARQLDTLCRDVED